MQVSLAPDGDLAFQRLRWWCDRWKMPPSDPRVSSTTYEEMEIWYIADVLERAAREDGVSVTAIDPRLAFHLDDEADEISEASTLSREQMVAALAEELERQEPGLDFALYYERAEAMIDP